MQGQAGFHNFSGSQAQVPAYPHFYLHIPGASSKMKRLGNSLETGLLVACSSTYSSTEEFHGKAN